jgi:lipopolysaccharide export system protein LptA
MLKQFTNPLLQISFMGLLAFSLPSMAGKDDFTQTIEIASNYQEGDGIAKKFLYRGDVLITQGSLLVKADEVEVDASQGEGKEIFIAKGQPAEYSQQQEDGSVVTAKATRIEYRRDTRSLSLGGDAEIEQNNSSVKGDSIVFNMELEQIIAQGKDQQNGRVITIFQPESKTLPTEQQENPP